jgi:RND family efflux transporter MFP subunit
MRKIVALLLSALFLVSCGEEKKTEVLEKAKPVKTMIIGQLQDTISREFSGKVEATIKAELSFEVPGRLIKLPVKESTEVKKGELIAAIDPKRYQHKVDQQKAKYNLAKAQFERAAALVKQNYISRNEYDILESNMNVAKSNLNTAEKNLKDTVLYAPFDGFVAKKYVDNYEDIKAKEPIVSFHDIEKMDVVIQIPEYIVLQIKDGTESQPYVLFQGIKKEYPIKFKEFSSKADPDTQTYRAVYTLDAPRDINMLPGMSVSVKFRLPDFKNQKQPFYLIPASAVFSTISNKPHVWIVDSKTSRIKPREVKVANMTEDQIKVLDGLNPGDMIVIAGVNFLRNGDLVKPIADKK